MQHKFSKKEFQTEEWIKRATDDELVTQSILKHQDAPASIVCFHSQQMAEKYLKAYLVYKKKWYPKIHLLDTLWELCREVEPAFDEIKLDSVYLTSFYAATRYPGDISEFSWEDCKKAYKSAVHIKEFVLSRIPGDISMSNGFVRVKSIILIAIAVLITAAIYFIYQILTVPYYKPADSEVKSTGLLISESEIEGWKTYRNEQYGFEVKYPNTFFIYTTCVTSKGGSLFSLCIELESIPEMFYGSRGDFGARFFSIDITEYKEIDRNLFPCIGEVSGSIEVDGLVIPKCTFPDISGSNTLSVLVLSPAKTSLVSISASDYGKNKAIVNQILSTFKFIE